MSKHKIEIHYLNMENLGNFCDPSVATSGLQKSVVVVCPRTIETRGDSMRACALACVDGRVARDADGRSCTQLNY